MANTFGSQPLTGKSSRKMENTSSQALVAPVVPTTLGLAKKAHVINDTTKSGKQPGAFVLASSSNKLTVAVAAGSGDTDKWQTIASASITEITPA